MTTAQQLITIGICALSSVITRFLPFAIFNEKRTPPKFIAYLGKALPPAVFGMLIIFCLKDVDFVGGSHGLPELISFIVIIALHKRKHNMFLSILAGVACRALLAHFVF